MENIFTYVTLCATTWDPPTAKSSLPLPLQTWETVQRPQTRGGKAILWRKTAHSSYHNSLISLFSEAENPLWSGTPYRLLIAPSHHIKTLSLLKEWCSLPTTLQHRRAQTNPPHSHKNKFNSNLGTRLLVLRERLDLVTTGLNGNKLNTLRWLCTRRTGRGV